MKAQLRLLFSESQLRVSNLGSDSFIIEAQLSFVIVNNVPQNFTNSKLFTLQFTGINSNTKTIKAKFYTF